MGGLKHWIHQTGLGERVGDSPALAAGKRFALAAGRPPIVALQWLWYRTPRVEGTAGGTLSMGDRCSPVNTVFNLASGSITVGDDTIFGYNCLVLTGRHEFSGGQRASRSGRTEVPSSGGDISIGVGCWIASAAVITGGVTIGDHVVVAAGAVVTANVPDHAIVAGVPARVVGDTRDLTTSTPEAG